MPLDLADPGLRVELRRMLARAPEREPERAQAVASWLDSLPGGSTLAFYGCGGIARRLAVEHGESLGRHRAVFFTTRQEPDRLFHGHPKRDVEAVRAAPPQHIVLLSATFDQAMRQNLAGVDAQRMVGLAGIIRSHVSEEALRACLEDVRAEARRVARKLAEALPGDGPVLGLHLMNFGSVYRPGPLRRIREAGYRVALATTRAATLPMSAEAMESEGVVDHLYVASSDEMLQLVLLELLETTDLFTLFEFPKQFNNVWYVSAVARRARCATIAYADNFLSSFYNDTDYARRFSENTELDQQTIRACYRDFFRNVDAVIHKDATQVLDRFTTLFGASPERLFFLPYTEGGMLPGSTGMKRSARDGIRRIAFGHSLHQGFFHKEWYDQDAFMRLVRDITATGLGFTVYNSMDPDGSGWEDLMALARENPLFEYRTGIPYDRFLRELQAYDYGWLGFRFEGVPGEFVRTNLQLKVFAYAQAGLPTLVSPEFEHCRALVESNGLGLTVQSSDWPRLPEILDAFDAEACRARLEAFCRNLDVDVHVRDMIAFYDRLARKQATP
ncbi:hypothetical protein NNJEOMEG_02788 [Fundidesulfovibrio magnetotacticus]|uniref:DUF3880 domain-containing protein n=1 Tax=Fundidesulfovibrio magnetotacticus TaxID=2730080 RepID=A0A6V8LVG8_9BACT|nr:hypothetical protein [Fundidesulfovibrio magnetotacticus]GFK94940.1 hypothetical protein NNJEOMEG_02788 [Fundidesulfovibrio magnetotacticus]